MQGSETSSSKTLQIFPWRERTFGRPINREVRSFFKQKIAAHDEANPKVGWPQQEKRFFGKRGILYGTCFESWEFGKEASLIFLTSTSSRVH